MNHQNIHFLKHFFIETTAKSALACQPWIGRGKSKKADAAAVNAMREMFNQSPMNGRIVIGEGERDQAPMLFIGEKVGLQEKNQIEIDIAVDPLECTDLCARGENGSISVMVAAPRGKLLHAPDFYMEKLIWRSANNLLNLEDSLTNNVKKLANSLQKNISELRVIVLDRPRHQKIIAELRKLDTKVLLIKDGDIAASIQVALGKADLYVGSGGAPEGVIAAAALKSLGGAMQGKLLLKNNEEEEYAKRIMKTEDIHRIFHTNDLLKTDEFLFVASAITDALGMAGVQIAEKCAQIETMILAHKMQERIVTKKCF